MVHSNAPTGYEEQRDTTEAHKTSPAPTAAAITQEKDLLNSTFYAVDKRSVLTVAVDNGTNRSRQTMLSTARKKALQTPALPMVRSIRLVLYSVYQVHSPLIVTSLPTRPLQSRLEFICSRREESL